MVRDQPPRPANMANIVAINEGRNPYTSREPEVAALSPEEARARAESLVVLDVRGHESFAAGHIPRAITVPLLHSAFEQWAGWILPADGEVLLAVESPDDARLAVRKLAFVGLDQRARRFVEIGSWHRAGFPLVELKQIEPAALGKRLSEKRFPVLDVRETSEWDGGHIVSATHMNFKLLGSSLDSLGLSAEEEVAVTCAGGVRSVIACSILERHGFSRVVNLRGGMHSWQGSGLPVSEGVKS